jgi:GGDEF domain-containing protein
VNLSLSSWMKQLDSTDSYIECVLNCYRNAIVSIRSNLVVSDANLKRQVSGQLDRLASTVSRKTNVEALTSTAVRLDEILTEHRNTEQAVYEEEQIQLRRTVTALESLVRTISARSFERGEQLNEVLQNLEGALFEGDLSSTHRILQEQIRKLRTCLLTISEEQETTELELQANVSSLGRRTGNAPIQSLVSKEPLSSEVDAHLNTCVSTYTLFSLVLFKVNDMAQLSKHWSAEARHALLASVRSRIAEYVAPFDRIHGWADGEFVLILRSTLARATEEASRIRTELNSPYHVEIPGGLAQIQIGVSVGVVEYVPGEDVTSLMGRAELAVLRDREPLLACDNVHQSHAIAS